MKHPKRVIDPEDSRELRTLTGTVPARSVTTHEFYHQRMFRLSRLHLDLGKGILVNQVWANEMKQIVANASVPIEMMTVSGMVFPVVPVGGRIVFNLENPSDAPVEYRFRLIGEELV